MKTIAAARQSSKTGERQLWRAILSSIVAVFAVAACGGDDDTPPAPVPLSDVAHPIAATEVEAQGLTRVVGRSGRAGYRVVRDVGEFEESQRLVELLFSKLFGADVADDGSSVEIDCRRNPVRLAPLGLCYGEFRFESNRRDQGGPITTGTLFSVNFDNFNIVSGNFQRLRISGGFRIEYLTDYTDSPRTGTVRYTSNGLSTNREGTIFEPRTGALTAIYSDGRTVLESESRRYIDLDTASTSDAIGLVRSGRIRANFGSGFVDIDYSNWSVVDGVVQPGSTANVVGTEGSIAAVVVTAGDIRSTTLAVTITNDGVPTTFTIEVPTADLIGD